MELGPYSSELVLVVPAVEYGAYSEIVVVTPTAEHTRSGTAIVPPGRATARGRSVGIVKDGVVVTPVPGEGPPPQTPVDLEQFILDGLALNDPGNYILEELVIGMPAKTPDWLSGADSDGAQLGRDPLFGNRTITLRIRVEGRSTMAAALDAVGGIVDRLEEADRHPDGVEFSWSPAGSGRTLTGRCLMGEIKNMPITVDGQDAGWFLRRPVLDVELTCAPFLYGQEVNAGTVAALSRLLTMDLTGVPGDVPAEGRLVISDTTGNSRRHVEWGLEQRHYQPGVSPSLTVLADALTVTGYSGAYDAAGGNIVAGLSQRPSALCAITGRGDVGTYRVKISVRNTAPGAQFRLAWQEGTGPFRSNDYVAAPAGTAADWHELDLGLVTIPAAATGTQRWVGTIEGRKTTATGVPTVFIRHAILMPAGEAYGVIRAVPADTGATSLTAFDSFQTMAAGADLHQRVAESGQTWSTNPAGVDFKGWAPGVLILESGIRNAVLLGTTATDTESSVKIMRNTPLADPGTFGGPVARYVDPNNMVRLEVTPNSSAPDAVRIVLRVGGTDTTLARAPLFAPAGSWIEMTIRVHASGRVFATAMQNGRRVILRAYSSALAAGGVLASGVVGFRASGGLLISDYAAGVPAAELVAVPANRTLQVRHDAALVEQSAGVFGTPGDYRGSRFFVPPAGSENRTTRLAVKARRDDVLLDAENGVTDQLTVTTYLTPRYIAVPR